MRLADKVATMASSGAPLPYDAEVEWLEADGLAYIDTGIYPTAVLDSNVTVSFSRSTSAGCFAVMLGCRGDGTNTNYNRYCYRFGDVAGFFQLSKGLGMGNEIKNGINSFTGTPKVIGFNSRRCVIDDVVYGDFGQAFNTQQFPLSLYMFAVNSNGVQNDVNTGKYLRIFHAQIGDNELIPVKKNVGGIDVGFFYDKKRKVLLGNANSLGAFVIGPDKAASNGGGGITENA